MFSAVDGQMLSGTVETENGTVSIDGNWSKGVNVTPGDKTKPVFIKVNTDRSHTVNVNWWGW